LLTDSAVPHARRITSDTCENSRDYNRSGAETGIQQKQEYDRKHSGDTRANQAARIKTQIKIQIEMQKKV
jgi:hypothetical protein